MKYIYIDKVLSAEDIQYIYEHSKLKYTPREKIIRFISKFLRKCR